MYCTVLYCDTVQCREEIVTLLYGSNITAEDVDIKTEEGTGRPTGE